MTRINSKMREESFIVDVAESFVASSLLGVSSDLGTTSTESQRISGHFFEALELEEVRCSSLPPFTTRILELQGRTFDIVDGTRIREESGPVAIFKTRMINEKRTKVIVTCFIEDFWSTVERLVAALALDYPEIAKQYPWRQPGETVTASPHISIGVSDEAGVTHENDNLNDLLEAIPPGSNREIVRLWEEGKTASDIGKTIGRDPKTIRNQITLLRAKYPTLVSRRRTVHSSYTDSV